MPIRRDWLEVQEEEGTMKPSRITLYAVIALLSVAVAYTVLVKEPRPDRPTKSDPPACQTLTVGNGCLTNAGYVLSTVIAATW